MDKHDISMKFSMTPYKAEKVVQFVINGIVLKKQEMIDRLIDGSMNLNYLPKAYYLAYACMTLPEIRDIHMGMAAYQKYAEMYDIEKSHTYLGYLAETGQLNLKPST